ncbi:TPA: SIS domain-containing protein [Streptococcus equi subsp. zooepidemicus]|uniref:SIS domain-containing protein n=1 Tax=Streptococcus equi TaxID=1336 RepID=UPI0024A84AD1|nr:SIS domain-containing protein [Streptococcus equi]MDI5917376.1 SIS domain-containing protein [Streptococcus equi subsp. zooepidemicus]MDI5955631.1 SIS domain-containing protein [Streptococcus equi subsp. zooepidemicus]HEL0380469.1 SIS domain-containing protein [Streptococcus equi subsp. zooepidemicus]HEL0394669.1 SIS domain-containing protein [Streptococcus equi subsp. zooepidemicus]HEL0398704.1 SIS domain-containing protein [Streptococcus equi subsp. zooepidemicus]
MFTKTQAELELLGAAITTREIKQQPELWSEVFESFLEQKESLLAFFDRIRESANGDKVKIIFTGAGTSEYIGNTICHYLEMTGDRENYLFYSIASTDLVAAPSQYLFEEDTVVLVSFARSGNSPESVAAVSLVNQLVSNPYHLVITCAKEGALAQNAKKDQRSYLFLMPEASNDAGFAMTGSFSCMMLAALLIFDQAHSLEEKKCYLDQIVGMVAAIIQQEADLQKLVSLEFQRLVYLGSGALAGLTQEAQLKILELTAGRIATVYDSSMGFRHGPKSFIDDQTLVIGFVSNDPYTRRYDLDVLEEIREDAIAVDTLALQQQGSEGFGGHCFDLDSSVLLPDAYLAFPLVFIAQTIALLSSIKINNLPDTPSATGTVNRVVQGVKIYHYCR